MIKLGNGLLIVALLFSSGSPSLAAVEGLAGARFEEGPLEGILRKVGEYCARLERISLYFVCTEEIKETIFHPYRYIEPRARPWDTEVNKYVYDYQLIRTKEIEESRTLLEENGQPRNVKGAPLMTKRFKYRNIIFGPLGIFSFEAQERCRYSIERETTLWGVPVLIVRAVPGDVSEEPWLFGRAWVAKADGSILKAEWEQESVGNYDAMRGFARSINARPALKQESEYRFEKNGVRFPSRFDVNEDYLRLRSVTTGMRRVKKSLLTVRYKDYRYFTVETETGLKR